MNAVVTPVRYTPEDLLKMPEGDRYELIDGQLVERNMSFWSSYVAGETHGLLRDFCRDRHSGWLLPEGATYQCFPDQPAKVRKADVSFIKLERASLAEATDEGHITIAPDLAVEVLSPNDLAYEVDQKVEDYLRAGVTIVWVVYPKTRTVVVHRREGVGSVLRESDELSGEEVLPGFRCRVADLFKLPHGLSEGHP